MYNGIPGLFEGEAQLPLALQTHPVLLTLPQLPPPPQPLQGNTGYKNVGAGNTGNENVGAGNTGNKVRGLGV